MENATLVQVNKDGSGTITYRMFLSDQLTGMMAGMAGTMAALNDGTNQPPPELDPMADIKNSLEGQFGPDVKMVSTRDVTSAEGWKGVEAVYEFQSVADIHLQKGESTSAAGPGGPVIEQVGPEYAFQFTPGDIATLKLVPLTVPSSSEEPPSEPADGPDSGVAPVEGEAIPSATPAMGMPPGMDAGMEDMLGGMGLQMMAPMLKGMRVSMLISVDGEIVETNAKFRSEKHDNVVTLIDIAFDKVLNDPKGAKLLQSGQQTDPRELAKLDIEGLHLEEPDKELTIRFK
jgi:hypothetical protein